MRLLKNCFVALLFLFTSSLDSALGDTWAKTYGGPRGEVAFAKETTDGGFIVAGVTGSYGAGGSDLWILKLDSSGNIVWQKTYGEAFGEMARSVEATSNGGFIVAGHRVSYDARDVDVLILKLDSNGNIIWQKTYGGSEYDTARSIQETSDGGFIVAGDVSFFYPDLWILKLDSNGNIIWQKTYGRANEFESANCVQEISDGGFIVAGLTDSFGVGGGDLWILRLNSNGNIIWQKAYGGPDFDTATSVQETSDGGFIVSAYTRSFGAGYQVWILRLDSSGNIIWQKAYGDEPDIDSGRSVEETSDGGFIVCDATESYGTGASDLWLLKLDSNGNIIWQKTYGGSEVDTASSVEETSDGGFIVCGVTESYGAGSSDLWLLKLDSSGQISGCGLDADSSITPQVTNILPQDSAVSPVNTTVAPVASSCVVTDTDCRVAKQCPVSLSPLLLLLGD